MPPQGIVTVYFQVAALYQNVGQKFGKATIAGLFYQLFNRKLNVKINPKEAQQCRGATWNYGAPYIALFLVTAMPRLSTGTICYVEAPFCCCHSRNNAPVDLICQLQLIIL